MYDMNNKITVNIIPTSISIAIFTLSRNAEILISLSIPIIFPFLVGAVTGGAAVGLTRPRPIYNVAPQGPMMPPPGVPYGQYSYNYYYPFR